MSNYYKFYFRTILFRFQKFCQQKSSPFYSFTSPQCSPKGFQPIDHANHGLFQIQLKRIESSFIEVMEKAQELTVIIEKKKK